MSRSALGELSALELDMLSRHIRNKNLHIHEVGRFHDYGLDQEMLRLYVGETTVVTVDNIVVGKFNKRCDRGRTFTFYRHEGEYKAFYVGSLTRTITDSVDFNDYRLTFVFPSIEVKLSEWEIMFDQYGFEPCEENDLI